MTAFPFFVDWEGKLCKSNRNRNNLWPGFLYGKILSKSGYREDHR